MSLDRSLVSLATKKADRDGYGPMAHYMRLHESQHPVEITLHLLKIRAAEIRAQKETP